MFSKELVKNCLFLAKNPIALICVFSILALIIFLPRFFARQNGPFLLSERAVLAKTIDTLAAIQGNWKEKINDEKIVTSHQNESSEGKVFLRPNYFD